MIINPVIFCPLLSQILGSTLGNAANAPLKLKLSPLSETASTSELSLRTLTMLDRLTGS